MEILFKTILVLHVAGGATGLIAGTTNIIRKKGDRLHRLVGKCFLFSMLTAGFSALLLSYMITNYFLFIVGVFTIYMTATGRRYISIDKTGKAPGAIDWVLTIFMLMTAVVFLGLGVIRLIEKETFGIVFIVFGYIGFRFSLIDISNYLGKNKAPNYWLTGHLQRMTGSYIASLTAFLVVNSKYLPAIFPSFVVWLLPTFLLLPFIFIWTRKYMKE